MFAQCTINEIKCKLLIDTGSPVSLLSKEVFEKFKISQLEEIESTMTTANGNELKVKGKCHLPIKMEHFKYKQDMIVADLDGISGILGMDIFEKNNINIHIKSQSLEKDGNTIPLYKEFSSHCSRIQVLEKTSISPYTEKIVKGVTVEAFSSKVGVVEPMKWIQQKGLLVPKILVDKDNIYLSVWNLNSKTVKLKTGSSLANLYSVDKIISEEFEPEVEQISNTQTEPLNTNRQINVISKGDDYPEHLKSMLNKVSPCLNVNDKQKLTTLIKDYKDIFVGPDGTLGRTNIVKHTIDTGNEKPVKLHPRRIPIKQKGLVQEELDQMIQNDTIEPSNSPWASPVCIVTKRDGSIRFCIDFRKLNDRTVKNAYPLPRIDETFDALTGGKWFTTLDLASGY